MPGEHLTGTHRVRAIRPAFEDASGLLKKTREKCELRRHSLKLRYWPDTVDLSWSWIKSLDGMKVGELRIDDTIGGNDNLRIIFFVGDSSVKDPLPLIWVIRVMQKKRMDFSKNDLRIFKARRLLVIERFYKR